MRSVFIILMALGIVAMPSCKKKLDLNPTASLAPETVTANDIGKLLNGIYDALQNGGTTFYYLSDVTEDLSADNLRYRATFFQHGEVDNNAILSNNVLTERYFIGPYNMIQRSNDVIEIAEASSLPEATKKNALGVAYFARAFGYYRLVTLFGGVPILLTRSIEQVPRNTEAETYNQIIVDLLKAIDNAPSVTSNAYISSEAAKALLARVYLIRKDYQNAKKYAEEVINSGKFALTTNYEAMLNSPIGNPEVIFARQFTPTEGENSLYFFLQHPTMPGSGRAELPVDNSFIAAFEPNDIRRASIVQEIVAPASNPGWYVKKYRDPAGAAAHPIYVVRLAEMYLISAEAEYFISNMNTTNAQMLNRLNEVRTKRGLTAVTSADLYTIIRERRIELAFENLRWTDLKRTPDPTTTSKSMAQVYVESKGRTVNDLLYPIPQNQIDVNPKLVQNPGY
ncbi:RagB/SusD family nutrient uptake outer membrane protein [Aridibaculum aurantiacum]|uniref:RagB/SusD family nutrient uptake outer membrane protein n=1 Tax=Aridibaculum aurantiacum TaxID=2810307 RepID=UPI001A96C2B9|nr:RagB/SusD family nutrient uptake outer membrane protein [Aridibaculum aurantiacum]